MYTATGITVITWWNGQRRRPDELAEAQPDHVNGTAILALPALTRIDRRRIPGETPVEPSDAGSVLSWVRLALPGLEGLTGADLGYQQAYSDLTWQEDEMRIRWTCTGT